MFDRVFFIIGEAFVALRRNLPMALAGITTGAVSLFLFGLLAFSIELANDYAKTIPSMFDMRVFLNDGVSTKEAIKTVGVIRTISGISKVVWIPRDKAWAKMQLEHPELTKGLQNPLPDQIKVEVGDLHKGDQIAQSIQALPTVVPEDGVHYLRQEQRLATAILDALKVLGPELGALLLVATGILIYNTIRLTVLSRRLEIRIMQMVGAPASMVRIPFLIEGTIQGLLAGLCAGLLLLLSFKGVAQQLEFDPIQIAAIPIKPAMVIMILVGGVYGLLCSIFAVRVPLQYR